MKNKSSPVKIYFGPPVPSLGGGVFHYKSDRNLRNRPEPGCDDGPPAFPWDKSWDDPEPWDHETARREQLLFNQADAYINDYEDIEAEGSSYVHVLAQVKIPVSDVPLKFDLQRELAISKGCRTAVASLMGRKTGSIYYAPMKCDRFWCPRCGGRHGFMHERRKNAAYTRMNNGVLPRNRAERRAVAAKWDVGQYVFTTPETGRERFMTREGANEIYGAAKRTIKRFERDTNIMAALQVCSDDQPKKFYPHVHVLVFYGKGEHRRLKRTPEELASIKDRWAMELRAIGFEGIRGPGETIEGKRVDVHYNFAVKTEQVLQRVNYASRPLGAEHLKAWQESENGQAMIDLCVRELKGFRFIRYWGKWAGCKFKDRQDVRGEVQSIIREPVEYLGVIPMAQLQELVRSGRVKKIGRDLYVRPGPFMADGWPQKNEADRKAGVSCGSGVDYTEPQGEAGLET